MVQEVETELKVGNKVFVPVDKACGTIVAIAPGRGSKPTEYRIKADVEGSLTKIWWRAEQLQLVGQQERLEV